MGFADLHIHSVHSHDGTCSVSAILKYVADFTNLDVIAITDHDRVTGVNEAVALGPRYGIDVVPGVEVSTAEGHLLALYVNQPVPAGRSLLETLHIVGKMGGLCVAPHPEAPAIGSLRAGSIHAALADVQAAKVLVGIETFNAGLIFSSSNLSAAALARGLKLACLGNSDSHILSTIGEGTTQFEGRTAADLRAALEAHATVAHASRGLHGLDVIRKWFPQYFLRRMGWVAWNEEPHAPIQYARMNQIVSTISAD